MASTPAVTFGDQPATDVAVVSDTEITCTSPAGTAGTVAVTVTAGGKDASLPDGFTYTA